jgi:hypothetical protein
MWPLAVWPAPMAPAPSPPVLLGGWVTLVVLRHAQWLRYACRGYVGHNTQIPAMPGAWNGSSTPPYVHALTTANVALVFCPC